jgi:hypothetical protein
MPKHCYYCSDKAKKAPVGYYPLWCPEHSHKKKGIYADRVRCKIQRCTRMPKFGFKHEKIATLCMIHKLTDMIDLTATICNIDGCKGKSVMCDTDNVPKYCRSHMEPEYRYTVQRCSFISCRKFPLQKYKYMFCEDHFIHGNPKIVSSKKRVPNIQLSTNINAMAVEYNLITKDTQQQDPLLKKEIDFSIKLDYVPVEYLLKELDDFHSFEFIRGDPELNNNPYILDDHIWSEISKNPFDP